MTFRSFLFVLLTLVTAGISTAQTQFAVYDVFVDSAGEELAGYQIIVRAPDGVKFAGVEGGEHAAYKSPPIYDSKAINRETIIIAALGSGTNLPREQTRVAALHVQLEGGEIPELTIKLQSAGSSALKRIFPKVIVRKRGEE